MQGMEIEMTDLKGELPASIRRERQGQHRERQQLDLEKQQQDIFKTQNQRLVASEAARRRDRMLLGGRMCGR
jgi:hypothetical protein